MKNTKQQVQNIKIHHPLHHLNSWKVGGPADFFYEPKTLEDIYFAMKWAKEKEQEVTVLSGGTNVLISDKGVRGLVIRLSKLKAIESWQEKDKLYIKALAGVSKAQLMRIFAQHQLAPALFLCGLPGDVGGGVVMNAGVGQDIMPKEFKDIVDGVTVIRENKTVWIPKEKIQWGYRLSQGLKPGLIYEVTLSWPLKPLPDLPKLLRELALKRARSQPLQSASCGSVFKNPSTGQKAGALIEACGLKGHRVGGAKVSEKHANFILNTGEAKAEDIHRLIQLIQAKVLKAHNMALQTEVKYIGQWHALN